MQLYRIRPAKSVRHFFIEAQIKIGTVLPGNLQLNDSERPFSGSFFSARCLSDTRGKINDSRSSTCWSEIAGISSA